MALTERLCVYGEYIDPEWVAQGVLDVIKTKFWSFIPRRGSGRRSGPQPVLHPRDDHARPQRRAARAGGDHGDVRRDAARGDRGHARRRRRAARRARGGHGDVRRQPQHQRLQRLHRRLRVLRLRPGPALAGRLRALARGVRPRASPTRVAFGATELCIQSGIHPDWGLEDYEGWLRFAKELAPDVHLHAYSPMEVAHMVDVSGLSPRAVFARLREAGLDSTPGTAAEVLHDGVRERISPNKLPAARWVEIIEASHAEGLRSTVTVMFGHIEEPHELAEHMRVVRALQERTGGFTEFVPLSFIPFHTLLGRTHGIEEISREENLKHTAAFRLALGRSDPEPAGELGEDGPRRRHRGAALGRQRPRRHADGGVDLAHGRLLPRRPPRARRPDRRRPRRRPPGGGAHDALRHPPPLRARGRGLVADLVLGPALRYAGETEALIWVETDAPCTVSVLGCEARTFCVEGHHYALVQCEGLEPGKVTPYEVALDGEPVWPLPDSPYPPSVVRTHDPDRPTRIVFGSCRVCAPHEPPHSLRKDEHPDGREVDALRALVHRMRDQDPSEWPEALILLGDQVYADEVSPDVREFIRSRRDPEVPPGETVADFEEYTRLYWESWGEPYMRWLLSTVPSSMIFDDHDVHDDWNTSKTWVTDIRAQGWWDDRIVGGFMSYWIYQHLGNLSPRELDELRRLRPRAGGRGRVGDPQRLRLQGRPRGRGHALELLPRHRPGAAGDGRLARRPGARPGRAQHGRRGRVAVDRGAGDAATASTC